MQITEAERSGKLVVRAENISYQYENQEIIKNFSVEKITQNSKMPFCYFLV